MNLNKSYKKRLKLLAGLSTINEAISFSNKDLSNAYDKSSQRIQGFDINMIKTAIKEGRAIGVSYKSNEMPTIKFRVILPVTVGSYKTKTGTILKLSAFHLAGQSEKAARKNGKRSEEASNVWRLFDLNLRKFKGMWFTDSFFYEYPPGYKKGDRRFSSIQQEYDTGMAELYRIEREESNIDDGVPIQLRNIDTQGGTSQQDVSNDNEKTDKKKEQLDEKKEKNPLYVKKPWLKYLRNKSNYKK